MTEHNPQEAALAALNLVSTLLQEAPFPILRFNQVVAALKFIDSLRLQVDPTCQPVVMDKSAPTVPQPDLIKQTRLPGEVDELLVDVGAYNE